MQQGAVRASGEPASHEVAREESKENDKPVAIDIERKRTFRTPGFQRMRTEWNGDDAIILTRVQTVVRDRILENFKSAFQVMHEVYDLVRVPDVDENGEVVKDEFGFPRWRQTSSGSYEEDWTKLGKIERDNMLFTITTRLFEWSLRAADAWGEAMLAKAMWEESFSLGFEAPISGTMGDREAAGRLRSTEERYFAIFVTLYSRHADAIVKSMESLALRLRDSLIG